MRLLLALACASFLGACAAPVVVNVGVPFDAAAAQRMLADGPNTVRGNAFLRQRGGGVVTCAGAEVVLVPATAYAQRVFAALYGTSAGAAMQAPNTVDIQPKSVQFSKLLRRTQCDAQGNFVFERVADGDWFVETTITWVVGNSPQGGPIMRRVSVAGGSSVTVIVAP